MDKLNEAARTVAAVFDFAAVGIENPVAEVCLRMRRMFDQQYLIAANTELAVGEGACARCSHFNGLAHPIQDHKIITGAVHFCEVPNHVGIIAHLFVVLP
jgi:hypothetical protein